ncbi:hypothetical protein [Cognatazoarcus halotolerans]|uniref:hypothetical protein n=1 Tax=Cognatazoarcus halotolerans TaxID=2686016 RepID=UPI00135A6AD4|nr:hypothetical protein [Cognatazoarcus halotolerans]MBX3679673.1 hypothetical protein [Rhodocyclaceae bacterium]MCB1902349.1 hypothetical protein [Rhodocyclaceae bacterium]MCP5307955.1 hypothetical protein [Zoogloeaceae bacterium]
MDAEISKLEQQVEQLVSLFEAERSENRALRTRVAELEGANRRLKAKVDAAAARIDEVLQHLPQVS